MARDHHRRLIAARSIAPVRRRRKIAFRPSWSANSPAARDGPRSSRCSRLRRRFAQAVSSIRCLTSGPSHHGHTVKQRVADGEAVAVAGDAELAHLADPARDLLAFRVALVEVVIARAQDDAGDARPTASDISSPPRSGRGNRPSSRCRARRRRRSQDRIRGAPRAASRTAAMNSADRRRPGSACSTIRQYL